MMRRCSVMRMPLAAHWASIWVGFGTIASALLRWLHHRIAGRDGPSERHPRKVHARFRQRSCSSNKAGSAEVAPQHARRQRRHRLVHVVARPPADLAKTGTVVEPERRLVPLLDLEKHRANTEAGKTPQMQIEQPARNAATAPARRDRDREDFRLAG